MAQHCPGCFSNAGLARRIEEIRPSFDEGPCDLHPRRKGIPIEAIGAIVDEVFRNNFCLAGADSFYTDDEGYELAYNQRGEDLRTTLVGLTGAIDPAIVDALADTLIENDEYWPGDGEEAFYDDEYQYERVTISDGAHSFFWQQFRETIMHQQRFFNREADGLLAELFKSIHLQSDEARKPPVYMLNPNDGRVIHRARLVEGDVLREINGAPEQQMGCPPRNKSKPNRMNPSGILALYGSFERDTCVSELRPVVGCRVVTAEFHLRRPICVLDTTRFQAPPKEINLFAKDHSRRLSQWRFMQRFMSEIAVPISKDDEHLDYVPTQAVAEYLSQVHEVRIGKERRRIEAIIFKSAQRPTGTNIVFFGEAAMIQASTKPSPRPARSITTLLAMPLTSPEPSDPGLVLNASSLSVLTVSEAAFLVGNAEPLAFALNPPF